MCKASFIYQSADNKIFKVTTMIKLLSTRWSTQVVNKEKPAEDTDKAQFKQGECQTKVCQLIIITMIVLKSLKGYWKPVFRFKTNLRPLSALFTASTGWVLLKPVCVRALFWGLNRVKNGRKMSISVLTIQDFHSACTLGMSGASSTSLWATICSRIFFCWGQYPHKIW